MTLKAQPASDYWTTDVRLLSNWPRKPFFFLKKWHFYRKETYKATLTLQQLHYSNYNLVFTLNFLFIFTLHWVTNRGGDAHLFPSLSEFSHDRDLVSKLWRESEAKCIASYQTWRLLKLSRDVEPYKIYQMVYILMLLWRHARFQSPASSKLNITICDSTRQNTNLLLTEREGRTGEYWPEVVAVWTERSEVRTKTIEGQYSPVRLELARLVSSLLYGTQVMFVLNFPAFENKKIRSLWPFPRKRSVWRNPDRERTYQNAPIFLAI